MINCSNAKQFTFMMPSDVPTLRLASMSTIKVLGYVLKVSCGLVRYAQ
jgi:hypothetical protein